MTLVPPPAGDPKCLLNMLIPGEDEQHLGQASHETRGAGGITAGERGRGDREERLATPEGRALFPLDGNDTGYQTQRHEEEDEEVGS